MSKLKRFLLFSGSDYYPGGGWDDFVASFDTLEEAKDRKSHRDWNQMVDSETGEAVLHE